MRKAVNHNEVRNKRSRIGQKHGNIIATAKKWVQEKDFNAPQPEHCQLLEKVLDTEPGYFSKIFGYFVQYDAEDCKRIRDFYRENIRNSNKSLVYILIAASDKGRSKDGISIKELIEENPEINLKEATVTKKLEELLNEGTVKKNGADRFAIKDPT